MNIYQQCGESNMSINRNFKKDKCQSCEYFCGKRDYKRGAFLGDSVSAEGRGTCSNKRSSNYNKSINDEGDRKHEFIAVF